MKKFLIYLSMLSMLIGIINLIFFLILKYQYRSEYEKFTPGFRTYLFADSHGLPLSNFLEEKGIYNFSAGSESYYEMLTKIKYANRMGGVDTILLSVDDHMLSPLRETMNNKDRVVYFAAKEDFEGLYEFVKIKGIQYWITLLNPKAANFLSEYFQKKAISKFQAADSAFKDWQYLPESTRMNLAKNRMIYFFRYKEPSKLLGEKLEGILNYCKKEGITVIGIKFPLAEEFISVVNEKSYGADSIVKKRNVPVYDFSKVYKSNIEKFSNQDHLTKVGGREFSNLLMKEISR